MRGCPDDPNGEADNVLKDRGKKHHPEPWKLQLFQELAGDIIMLQEQQDQERKPAIGYIFTISFAFKSNFTFFTATLLCLMIISPHVTER